MISPFPLTVFGPGGCPAFTTRRRTMRREIDKARSAFLLLAWLIAEFGGLLLLELRELILHGGSEVAHIEEPADFDRYLIVSGDARGPFERLFARLHINYPVAADHLLRFGKRAVGDCRFSVFEGDA